MNQLFGHSSIFRLRKGSLKTVTILCLLFSTLFITYQLISYVAITNYQAEEAHALRELSQKIKDHKYKSSLGSNSGHYQSNKFGVGAGEHVHEPGDEAKYFRKKGVISPVLGVSPSAWKHYSRPLATDDITNHSYFMCVHSGNQISWDKVNDDYCDCPDDGSDEPSTNACINGQFFCTKTAKKFPEHVPSSRVNDNICDCCDGSDEIFTKVHCKKQC